MKDKDIITKQSEEISNLEMDRDDWKKQYINLKKKLKIIGEKVDILYKLYKNERKNIK